MAKNSGVTKTEKEKLTIPIYLNTKIVFDMLATIEDGFSEMRNIQTSKSISSDETVGADVGTGNIFAWLNIGVSANKKDSEQQGQTTTEQRTHTTVSLFQKLRSILDENNYIKRDSDEIKEGDFIEIQGVLKVNPLIDFLCNLQELIKLANAFDDNKNNNKSKTRKMMENQKLNTQIDALIQGMQIDGKKDIICVTDEKEVVINTDVNYFLNRSMSEITDGRYKVLGKVTKVCCDQDESISLLRNTAFSKLKLDKMKEFHELFNSQELSPFLSDEEIKSEIAAPTMMIIPIAIYI